MYNNTPTGATRARPFNAVSIALSLSIVLALAGCGGGGGSSGGGSTASTGGSSFARTISDSVPSAAFPAVKTSAQAAAAATPNEGSVTQSSNVSGGVTTDDIAATADYDSGALRVSVTNSRSDGWGTVNSGASDTSVVRNNTFNDASGNATLRERAVRKTTDDGVVIVDTFTNRLTAADTDYLVGGVWLFVPDSAAAYNSDLEIGAFVDGSIDPTPSAYLRTAASATYTGETTGVYVEDDAGIISGGEFVSDVSLTASFGANPSISGRAFNFVDIDENREAIAAIPGAVLNFGAANIADSAGGFFTGDTSANYLGNAYAGKWGGQFYGGEADYAAGTFGASTDTDDYDLTFVGAFAAPKD